MKIRRGAGGFLRQGNPGGLGECRSGDDELAVEIRVKTPGGDEEHEENGKLYDIDEGGRRHLPTVMIRRGTRKYTYPVATGVELVDGARKTAVRNGLVVRIEVD